MRDLACRNRAAVQLLCPHSGAEGEAATFWGNSRSPLVPTRQQASHSGLENCALCRLSCLRGCRHARELQIGLRHYEGYSNSGEHRDRSNVRRIDCKL